MSNLNNKFNVVMGWHGGHEDYSTITETFEVATALKTANELVDGDIVSLGSTGTVDRATSDDWAAAGTVAALAALLAEAKKFWLVVTDSSATGYDTRTQTGVISVAGGPPAYEAKYVSCIRGTYVFETELFTTQAYVPGDSVCVVSGVLDLTKGAVNPGYQPFGEVLAYDAAATLLTVAVG